MFQINLKSGDAIYLQLKEQVVRLALAGALEGGEQLPSVRVLARELGINPNTVSKAYQELEAEGVLYSIAGKGSFCQRLFPVGRILVLVQKLCHPDRPPKGAQLLCPGIISRRRCQQGSHCFSGFFLPVQKLLCPQQGQVPQTADSMMELQPGGLPIILLR